MESAVSDGLTAGEERRWKIWDDTELHWTAILSDGEIVRHASKTAIEEFLDLLQNRLVQPARELESTGDTLSFRQQEMIAALELTAGNVVKACAVAGVSSSTHYYWVDTSPEYRASLRLLERETIARLEAEADRRALEGVIRLKFHRGEAILDPRTGKPYEEREYSDAMLALRLRALDPERYRDRHDLRISQDEAELDAAFARLVAEATARGETSIPGTPQIEPASDGGPESPPETGGVPGAGV